MGFKVGMPVLKLVTGKGNGKRSANYRKILTDGGIVHLKTDSPFLYTYTHALVELNGLPVDIDTADLYHSGLADDILEIKTHYEKQWLERGLTIQYIKFHLPQAGELQEPDIEIPHDTYRSYNRGYIEMPQHLQPGDAEAPHD